MDIRVATFRTMLNDCLRTTSKFTVDSVLRRWWGFAFVNGKEFPSEIKLPKIQLLIEDALKKNPITFNQEAVMSVKKKSVVSKKKSAPIVAKKKVPVITKKKEIRSKSPKDKKVVTSSTAEVKQNKVTIIYSLLGNATDGEITKAVREVFPNFDNGISGYRSVYNKKNPNNAKERMVRDDAGILSKFVAKSKATSIKNIEENKETLSTITGTLPTDTVEVKPKLTKKAS